MNTVLKKLQQNTIILLFAVTVLLSLSCKKYLSPAPLSTIDPSVVFDNVPNAKAAVMGAYLGMAGDFGYGGRVSVFYAYDDDCILGGGSYLSDARTQEAHYMATAANTDIVNTFNLFYAGIERANNCIYFIPKMPQYINGSSSEKAELQRLLGESLVIRAQYYFELIRLWGDVPTQWQPSMFLTDLFLGRTSRDTIYDHILADLVVAKPLMPWRTEVAQDERFTKGTAMALRAKIALFAGGYSLRQNGQMSQVSKYLDYYKITKAETDTLIANRNQHTLFSGGFKSFWKDVIDAHKPVDGSGELIMQIAEASGSNADSKIGIINGTKINGVGGSYGNMLPTYFYQFDSTDVRRDVSFVPFEVVRDVYGRGHHSNQVMYDGKFRRDWVTSPSYYMSSGATSGTNPVTLTPASNSSIQYLQLNWPLIRFSDVLLMNAEVDNEINNGPSANAIADFIEVSQRGHGGNAALVPVVPTDKVGFLKLLIRERGLEFGGEGIRKWDLIRWNLLGVALKESNANLANMEAGIAMTAPSYMAPPPAYTMTANLPVSMYFYQNAIAIDGKIWANSFYTPTPAFVPIDNTVIPAAPISSSNKVSWFKNTYMFSTFNAYLGYGFVTGKSELFPIPQAAMDANYNLKPQNPGY